MNISNINIGDIKPYPQNNRTHPAEQIALIARSIKEFGFNQPLVVDDTNEILVGHGRWLAAKELKLKTVPCYVVEKLTETQRKAYRILDNKLQNDSSWDFDALSSEILKLDEDNFPCEEWGLDKLLLGIEEEDPESVEDEAPEPPKETFIKLGDVIELGAHRLMCGDSTTDGHDVVADMVITDPPYGVAYVGKTKDALTIENDDIDEEKLKDFWYAAQTQLLSRLKDGGSAYVSIPSGPMGLVFENALHGVGVLRQRLQWIKDSMVLGHSDYHYKHEPILYGWKPGAAHYFTDDRTRVSTLEVDRPKRSTEHPTIKPIELWAQLISNSSRKGEKVYDPFLGSGTTLIACEQLGRACYGMEIEPKYCHVIVKRYATERQRTGKPIDIKINGEPFPTEWIDY